MEGEVGCREGGSRIGRVDCYSGVYLYKRLHIKGDACSLFFTHPPVVIS